MEPNSDRGLILLDDASNALSDIHAQLHVTEQPIPSFRFRLNIMYMNTLHLCFSK